MVRRVAFVLFVLLAFIVLVRGPVTSISFCEDNEEGKTVTLVGTTRSGVLESGSERSVVMSTDYCYSSTAVKEYYCENNALRNEIINCGAGFMCEIGACIEKAFYCDGPNATSRNASLKQTVTVGYIIERKKGAGSSYSDECIGNSSVKEYYCLPSSKGEETIACPANSPCINGACEYTAPEIPAQRLSINARTGKFLFSVPFAVANVSTTCSNFNLKKVHVFTETTESLANPSSLLGGVYWFDAASDCAINLKGRNTNSLSGTLLRAGWNRIGSTNETLSASTIFSNCELRVLVKFNSFSSSILDMVSPSDYIQAGGAYLALVKKSCKLS